MYNTPTPPSRNLFLYACLAPCHRLVEAGPDQAPGRRNATTKRMTSGIPLEVGRPSGRRRGRRAARHTRQTIDVVPVAGYGEAWLPRPPLPHAAGVSFLQTCSRAAGLTRSTTLYPCRFYAPIASAYRPALVCPPRRLPPAALRCVRRRWFWRWSPP